MVRTVDNISITFVVSALGLVVGTYLAWIYLRRKSIRRKPAAFVTDSTVKHTVQLIGREELSWNARRFRFQIDDGKCLGLQPGQHIYVSATINDSLVVRPYSPVTTNEDIGFFEIIVKVYFKDSNPRFPNGGKMSQYLNNLRIGETVQVRGPAGRMVYNVELNEFRISQKNGPPQILNATRINLIAGGSGITPVLQVLHAIFLKETVGHLQVSLIYANQTEDDILCRSYLDDLTKLFPKKLHVFYTLSQPTSKNWPYGIGRVNEQMFKDHLQSASSDTIQLLCGPNAMIATCLELLHGLGFSKERSFVY